MTVAGRADQIVVEVADDGVGGADPRAGSGLTGLSDRVDALDGTLELSSAEGAGTTVRVTLPGSAHRGRDSRSRATGQSSHLSGQRLW